MFIKNQTPLYLVSQFFYFVKPPDVKATPYVINKKYE